MATRIKTKPRAPRAKPATATTYDVVGVLHHDGDEYAPGETIDLEDYQAQELLELSVPPIKAAADAKG